MNRTPSMNLTLDVLEAKAQVHATLMTGDERVADLAPAMRDAANRLAEAMTAAKAARWEVGSRRTWMEQAEAAIARQVRKAEAALRVVVEADRNAAAYRATFPNGLTGLTGGKRAAWLRRVRTIAEVLATTPGMEAYGKAVMDATATFQAAEAAWSEAAHAAHGATRILNQAKRAVVDRYRLDLAVITGRMGYVEGVNAFFPDLGVAPVSTPVADSSAAPAAAPPSPAHAA